MNSERRSALPVSLIAILLLICLVSPGWGQVAPSAAAVKTAVPRVIDGNAADWAAQKSIQVVLGADGAVVNFKLAYDATALYALIEVIDDSPLKNASAIPQELLKGGDALSLCFGPAGGKGANQRLMVAMIDRKPMVIAMRPQWPEKRPYSYFTEAAGKVAFDFVAPVLEVKCILRQKVDGYLAELAIPWTTLGYVPTDGMQVPFDLQVIFSDPAGTLNLATAWWHSTGNGPNATMDMSTEARLYPGAWGKMKLYATDPGPRPQPRANQDEEGVFTGPGTPIVFDLPRNVTTSVIVTDDKGWVVSELLRAVMLKKGKHTIYWNGRDRSGHPMPPGDYKYRVGYFDGIKTSFYGSVGNSGRPVYRTEDGMGSIGGTHGGPSAISADANGIYMLNSVEEGQRCLRKIGVDGKAKWFASTGVFGAGLAMAADDKYAYMVYGSNAAPLLVRLDAQTGRPINIGTKNSPIPLGKATVMGMAVIGNMAYISSYDDNRIIVINLDTGIIEADISLVKPGGLFRTSDKKLLACSGTQVVSIDPATRQTQPIITDLEAARAVAVDAAGQIYVSDLGASEQIKKFSAVGKLLATFGTKGGRPATVTKYDPLQFRNVTGLAIGPDGNLWLVEQADAPRRYARMTTDGKWLEDFYGPTGYVVVGTDLDDMSIVYYQAHQGSTYYIKAKIDYAAYKRDPGNPAGAWSVEAIYNLTQNGIDQTAKPDLMSKASAISYNRALAFTGENGKRYFWLPGGEWSGIWLWEDGNWKPVAAVHTTPWIKSENRIWADANGDGLIQPDEMDPKTPSEDAFVWIDRNLNLYTGTGVMKPARIDARGVPYYSNGSYTSHVDQDLTPIFEQINYFRFAAPPAPGNIRYIVGNVGPDRGLNAWDRALETRLIKVEDGKVKWIIGHHDGRFYRNGDNILLMNLTGESDGVIVAAEVNSNFTAYTSDGLTLGWVCGVDNRGKWTDVGPTAMYVENVQPGLFLKDPKTGKHLLFAVSTEDARVLEIDGVFGDQITRLDGNVKLPSAPPRIQLATPPAGQWTIPYSTWPFTSGGRYMGVDGYDWEWAPDVPAISLLNGDKLQADVRLRRDAGKLCIFADIIDSTPLAGNATTSKLDQLEGIELLLGPATPQDRTKAINGDTRILLSAVRQNGNLVGIANACRPLSAPLEPSSTMRPLDNKGKYYGDTPTAIPSYLTGYAAMPGVQIAVKERLDGRGYTLEAEIPLSYLPELAKTAPVTIKRQGDVNISEERLDMAAPLRFNVALYQNDKDGVMQRYSWIADKETANPLAMNPSAWGMANTQVQVTWSEIDGAQAYTIYRGNTPDPINAAAIKRDVIETTITDVPGVGDFYYWLAGIDTTGEGESYGPVHAVEGVVRFAAHQQIPAQQLDKLTTLYAFPGDIRQVNALVSADNITAKPVIGLTVKATRRTGKLWAIAVTPATNLAVGSTVPLILTVTSGVITTEYTINVRITNVPVNSYGVMATTLTNSTGRILEIDSKKPADGAAGQPAAVLNWGGQGEIATRSVGRHGFAFFRWGARMETKRTISAPFIDTFTTDTFGFCDGWNSLNIKVDGVNTGPYHTGKVQQNTAGSSGAVSIKATDNAVHTITVVTTVRSGAAAPPATYSIGDAVNGVTWTLAEFDGTQGHVVLQYRFIGSCTLTVTQNAINSDQNNRANIAGVFLD